MSPPLVTYLNNHLAGSVLAIELVEHAIDRDKGTPLESLYSRLLPEIQSDQNVLRELIEALDARESRAKKAAAWLGEKISRLKRDGGNDEEKASLIRMEEIEMLGLGIFGKRALWIVLQALAGRDARLNIVKYDLLIARADEQLNLVESFRLDLAKDVLLEAPRERS